eukprot:CAMPEP_0184309196 /NCGR_PEP_ID=MMETSP1049-20130417/17439_1 /TAXON_ID=77928 /ORGANISM="Proteomonas sulcata, Strain CCMP704" /LENGTH=88 /DNA_ID=CAMNT_0026622045 /DNA_START=505 /DNA_END=771 /DNA_ORIENTATION=-
MAPGAFLSKVAKYPLYIAPIPSFLTISDNSPTALRPLASCPTWQRCFKTSLGTKMREETALPETAASEADSACHSSGRDCWYSPFMVS